jgi:glutathionyl-hydroquinone reductase
MGEFFRYILAIARRLILRQAHRTIITRGLKSLEPVIQLILTDFDLTDNGWVSRLDETATTSADRYTSSSPAATAQIRRIPSMASQA